jgi:branched-chain amino acid transport system permease protein
VGALLLTPLGEGLVYIVDAFNIHVPGLKHLFYGVSMLLIMLYLPKGIWPSFKNRFFPHAHVI